MSESHQITPPIPSDTAQTEGEAINTPPQLVPVFPPELFRHIICHLHKPIPPPLSRVSRSAIRQPHLVTAARVSKLFKKYCYPLLYTHIVTDNLPRLLKHLLNAPWRHEHLHPTSITRSLFVEYSDKQEPCYEAFLSADKDKPARKQVWERCGRMSQEVRDKMCRQELKEFISFFKAKEKLPLECYMPNLVDIHVASIYGYQPDTWERLNDKKLDTYQDPKYGQKYKLEGVAYQFALLVNTGFVKNLCVRDIHGPLSLQPCYGSIGDSIPLATVHFQAGEIPRLPWRFNSQSRWVYDGSPDDDWNLMIPEIYRRIQVLGTLRKFNDNVAEPLDLTLFFSTSHSSRNDFSALSWLSNTNVSPSNQTLHEITTAQQQAWARELETEIKHIIIPKKRAGQPVVDTFRWRSSAHVQTLLRCCVNKPLLTCWEEGEKFKPECTGQRVKRS